MGNRITLDRWIALSSNQRNRLRRRWQSHRGYWIDLIDEAHRRFKRDFGAHPQVNDVRFTLRYGEGQEPEIHVITAQWSGQVIEELPDRYCTFRVIQKPNEDTKCRYLSYWTLVLGKLLGWSKLKVRKWARTHYENDLNGIGTFARYYEPEHYVVLALIPQSLSQRIVPDKRRKLQERLERAIQYWDYRSINFKYHPQSPDYDWNAARARVKKILSDCENRL